MRTMLMFMLVLCTMLPVLSVLAADDSPSDPVSGLEFGLPSSFGLDDLALQEMDGYDVSWTRRTSPARGWRIGATVYFDTEDDSMEDQTDYAQYLALDDWEIDYTRWNLALRAQRLFLSEPVHGVSAILGIGPIVGYSNFDRDSDHTRSYEQIDPEYTIPNDDYQVIEETSQHSFLCGATWDLGFEWRIRRQFSLGARYQWTLAYSNAEVDRKQTNITEGEDDRVSVRDESTDGFSLQNGGSVDLVATFWY